jgi:hypothetical protein
MGLEDFNYGCPAFGDSVFVRGRTEEMSDSRREA